MTRRSTALLFALFVSAQADTLTLRDGTTVTGSWVGIGANQIRFLVSDSVQAYPRSDVSGVTFGDAVPPPPATPPPPSPVQPPSEAAPPPRAISNSHEPEIIGAVYFRDAAGKLIPLERTQGTSNRSRIGFPASGREYWEVDGARSPVRAKSGQKMLFVIRLANGLDPNKIPLYPLEVKKANRRTEFDPKDKTKTAPLTLLVNVTKIGESYGLTPDKDLPAGEYAFSPINSNDAYGVLWGPVVRNGSQFS